jgi:hypothetical protein
MSELSADNRCYRHTTFSGASRTKRTNQKIRTPPRANRLFHLFVRTKFFENLLKNDRTYVVRTKFFENLPKNDRTFMLRFFGVLGRFHLRTIRLGNIQLKTVPIRSNSPVFSYPASHGSTRPWRMFESTIDLFSRSVHLTNYQQSPGYVYIYI